MNLFGRIRRRWNIFRLRSRVRRSPSPATYGQLAERLASCGKLDEAGDVAQKGLRLFPSSERLAQIHFFAKKKRLTGRIRQLKEDLARRPSPLSYARLAGIYRELGNDDDALEVAGECVRRFPLNESPYLIQGEIRLERFLRDMVANDALMAEKALRKGTRLNTQNVRPHLMLAQLYYVAGWITQCRRHLRAVLRVLPAARPIQNFLKTLDEATALEPEGDDFGELLRFVEDRGFANSPANFPELQQHRGATASRAHAGVDVDGLSQEIQRLGSEPGVHSIILLDKEGSTVAHSGDGDLSAREFERLVSAIRATADEASRRMDAGALVRAEIEGPRGSVTVARSRQLTIGLHYGEPLKPPRVWEIVQEGVARNLTAPGKEPARA